jgi:hypothetical protein
MVFGAVPTERGTIGLPAWPATFDPLHGGVLAVTPMVWYLNGIFV